MCSRCQSRPLKTMEMQFVPLQPMQDHHEAEKSICRLWTTPCQSRGNALRQLQPVRACVGAGCWQQLQPMEGNPCRSRFVKDCIQWERSPAGAAKKHEEGATETKYYEITATFPYPFVLLRGRARSEVESVKEQEGERCFQIFFFFFTSHYPTMLLVSPSLFWYFTNNSLYLS